MSQAPKTNQVRSTSKYGGPEVLADPIPSGDHPDFGGVPNGLGRRARKRIEVQLDWHKPDPMDVAQEVIDAAELMTDADHPENFVRETHGHLFKEAAGSGWGRFQTLARHIETTRATAHDYIDALGKMIRGLPHEIIVNENATPWNVLSWMKSILFGAGAVAMMVMSWLQVTTTMILQGVVETKLEASGYTIVPLAATIGLKAIGDRIDHEDSRTRFIWSIGGIGMAFLVVWVGVFASSYGHTLSPELLVLPEEGEESASDITWLLLGTGLLAEVCFGMVFFAAIDHIVASHRERVPNKNRQRLERLAQRVRDMVAWVEDTAHPQITEILEWHESAHASLINRALVLFRKRDGLRRNTVALREMQDGLSRESSLAHSRKDFNPNNNGAERWSE